MPTCRRIQQNVTRNGMSAYNGGSADNAEPAFKAKLARVAPFSLPHVAFLHARIAHTKRLWPPCRTPWMRICMVERSSIRSIPEQPLLSSTGACRYRRALVRAHELVRPSFSCYLLTCYPAFASTSCSHSRPETITCLIDSQVRTHFRELYFRHT